MYIVPNQRPIVIKGTGPLAAPFYPRYLFNDPAETLVAPAVARLVRAFENGGPIECSGEELRHVLEVAIALKQSAHDGHRRVELPIADRSARIFPHPHRLKGGDEVGWDARGYERPPDLM